jgi:hypothetical protein
MNLSPAAWPQPSSTLQPTRAWSKRTAETGMSDDTRAVALQRAGLLHVPLPAKAEPTPIWPLRDARPPGHGAPTEGGFGPLARPLQGARGRGSKWRASWLLALNSRWPAAVHSGISAAG